LAAHMAAMLPLVAVTFMATRSWWLRAIALLSGAFTVNTVILCRTRSAFVGLACGAVAAICLAPRRKRVKVYAAMAMAGACSFLLTDAPFWERMGTLQNKETIQQDESAMGRIDIWKTAAEIIAENPWGIGIGNFQYVLGKANPQLGRRAAHNTYILCWAELGTQGFVLLLILILIPLIQARQCYRNADVADDPVWVRYMSYGIITSTVISLGTQMFTERLYTESFWWILALPGCLKRVVIHEGRAKRLAATDAARLNHRKWENDNPLLTDGLAPGALA